MAGRSFAASALAGALALSFAVPAADALTVVRITRRGYIVVDEPEAAMFYEGRVPVNNTQQTLSFAAALTQAIDAVPDAPHGDYVAVMQTSFEQGSLAFYLGMINDTLGIGIRSPLDRTRERYDLNPLAGTAFPVTGFVFLNSIGLYQDGPRGDFGRYLICTQEFGHRFGTTLRIPTRPGNSLPAGGLDGGAADAGDDAAAEAGGDANPPSDAAAPYDGPDLAEDDLLGRQRAHWSYFVNSGGSPMEGNNWEEITPGTFRTGRPTFRFSPLDLYVMGLLPASAVPPLWMIAQPDVLNQRDQNGARINRESPTEYSGRSITIRGRRVTYTMDDIVRRNGPRVPAYRAPDGDAGADGGSRSGDLDVVWVLLTTPDRVADEPTTNALAERFDRAIDSCTLGYNGATGDRSRLVANVVPTPEDAGVGPDGGDAAGDGALLGDGAAGDAAPRGDGGAEAADGGMRAGGGCGCATTPARGDARGEGALAALLAGAAALAARRRRTRPN